jgi:hypothetical protein
MFLTNHFLAFQGWPETRILIPLGCISQVEKGNTLHIIPNAIRIMYDGEEYFFGSFANRGKCYQNLCALVEEAKKLVVPGKENEAPWAQRDLVFGYQKDSMLVIGGRRPSVSENIADTSGENSNGTSNGSTARTDRSNSMQDDAPPTPKSARKSSVPPITQNMRPALPDEPADNISFNGLFEKSNISTILNKQLSFSADAAWDAMWKDPDSFKYVLLYLYSSLLNLYLPQRFS